MGGGKWNFSHTFSRAKKKRSFLLAHSIESTCLIQYDSYFYSDSVLLSCVRDCPPNFTSYIKQLEEKFGDNPLFLQWQIEFI